MKIPRQSLRKVIVLLNFTSTYTVFKLLLQLKLVVWHALLFLKPDGMEVLLPISKPALTVACKIIAQTDPNSTESIVAGLLCSYLLLQVSSDWSYVRAVFLKLCPQHPGCREMQLQILNHNKIEFQKIMF